MDPTLDPFAEPDPPCGSPLDAFKVPPCNVRESLGEALVSGLSGVNATEGKDARMVGLYGGPCDGAQALVAPWHESLTATGIHGIYRLDARLTLLYDRETWIFVPVPAQGTGEKPET